MGVFDREGAMLRVDRYTSADVQPQHRHEAWRARPAARTGRLFDTEPVEPFACRSEAADLGGLFLGFTDITAQHWRRTTDLIRADGADHIAVSVRFAGAAIGDAAGCSFSAGVGSIAIADMARPHVHWSAASDTAMLALDRTMVESRFGSVEKLHGHVIAPDHAVLLVDHLQAVRRQIGALPVGAVPALRTSITALFDVALMMSLGQGPIGQGAEARTRIVAEQIVARRLGQPSFSVDRLGAELGVSRSTLFRLFRDEGGPAAYIAACRLAAAERALADGRDRRRLADIAEGLGFCDAAYFGRLFRERFGVTPGAYRLGERR